MTSQDYVDAQKDNEDDAVKDIKAGNRAVLCLLLTLGMCAVSPLKDCRPGMRMMVVMLMVVMIVVMMMKTLSNVVPSTKQNQHKSMKCCGWTHHLIHGWITII